MADKDVSYLIIFSNASDSHLRTNGRGKRGLTAGPVFPHSVQLKNTLTLSIAKEAYLEKRRPVATCYEREHTTDNVPFFDEGKSMVEEGIEKEEQLDPLTSDLLTPTGSDRISLTFWNDLPCVNRFCCMNIKLLAPSKDEGARLAST